MPYDFNAFKTKLSKVEGWLTQELATIRTGRANPALLDSVKVGAYGALSPLKQLGSLTVEDSRRIRLTLWDKTQIKAVEGAIAQAGMGLSVTTDNQSVIVSFPELTADRRELLVKTANKKLEEARISLRQERDKVWQDIQEGERTGLLSEDEKFRSKNELQKLVDAMNGKLEEMAERKEKEITS